METTLTAEQVLESNRMIAEFMGYENQCEDWCGSNILEMDGLFGEPFMRPFDPDKRWDDLMPVVDRIEKHGCIIEISYALVCNCRIVAINGKNPSVTFINDNNGGKPAIEAVYRSVIEFIQWHKQSITSTPIDLK